MEVSNLKVLLSTTHATALSPFFGSNLLLLKAHTDLRTQRTLKKKKKRRPRATHHSAPVSSSTRQQKPEPELLWVAANDNPTQLETMTSSLPRARWLLLELHSELSRPYTGTDGTNLCRINLQSMVCFPCQGGQR